MAAIEKYGHGGDRMTAAEQFGRNPEDFLDFSANINPLGPPPSVIQLLKEQIGSISSYPDPGHRRLRKRLADALGISAESIVVGNGAAECMALAVLALLPKNVGLVYPCFSEYEQLSRQFGANVQAIYANEKNGFQPEWTQLRHLFAQTDLVFIGHPNNPTGTVYSSEQLAMIAEWSEEWNTYVVMDEAFLDFLPEEQQCSLISAIEQYRRMIVVRSMTKMYAIPGLRLGYAAACPELAARLKSKQVTWSVNQLAMLAGEACLREEDYVAKTRRIIEKERLFLAGEIRKMGWRVVDGKANYLLLELPERFSADEAQDKLGRMGILVRNCSMYPGLTQRHIRIAVKNREDNLRLLRAFYDLDCTEAKGHER